MHVFLSPHYDDAALSCGGLIYQLKQRGESVLIITVMGGDPPQPPPDTPIVRDLHQRWQAGDDPVATRRQEDAAAAVILGAHTGIFNFPDCVYRVSAEGVALYPTEESLWGKVHPDDPALNALMAMGDWPLNVPPKVIYAPLGVGDHVDHKLVRNWGIWLSKQGRTVKFYAEYPYTARNPQALEQALAAFKMALPPVPLQPESVQLHDEDVTAKLRAIAAYQSQISTFWQDVADMERATRAAMLEAGASVERYWSIIK